MRWKWLLVLLLWLPGMAWAQNVPEAVTATAEVAEVAEVEGVAWEGWWVVYIPKALDALGLLLMAGLSWLVALIIRKSQFMAAREGLVREIEVQLQKTYENLVAAAKKAAKNGKLTVEERKLAMQMTIDGLKDTAKGPALKLLKGMAEDGVKALIEKVLRKVKSK